MTEIPTQFGRYQILQQIGQGGMGTVYLAQDTQLDRRVALKVPHFRANENAKAMERFNREARAAATLHHANLCQVYDFGEIDGRPYLAMAFIEGKPLSNFVRPNRLQPERQVAALVRKLARAVQEAHDKGIIHRDLK